MNGSVLANAPCGFLSLDDDGVIRYANETVRRMLRTDGSPLEGRHVDEILTPGARIFYQTHVFPLVRANETLHEIYLSMLADDGERVPVLLNASRRVEGERALNDWVVVPMRRRYEFEDQLHAALQEAERANEAKSRLLSIVSHDIRSPLNAMHLGISLLASGEMGPVSEEQRRILERISRAGEQATRLVDELLEYARLKSVPIALAREAIALETAFANARELFEARARQLRLRLEIEPCPDIVVLADGQRLHQVMVNLVENAIDHTPDGGRVELAALRWPGRAGFRVSDTGCGIPTERLRDVFEPFVQVPTKRVRGSGGVGLGLAISREFVRAMGGEISVESAVEKGTTFEVVLPTPSTQ